jgi:hypothetical protein
MKNQLIGLVFVALLLSGCVTQKRCEQKFPPEISTVTETITKTVTVYRDTTIFVHMPGDTVRDTIEVVVDRGIANSKPSIHETKFAWSKAQVINGLLLHQLIQKDSVLKFMLDNAIRESTTAIENKTTQTRILEKNYVTGWQWFQIWLGRILVVLIVFVVIFRYFIRV